MSDRRWQPGSRWDTDGVHYEVTVGKKSPDDLILWMATRAAIKVPMSVGFICADFFNENEQRLFAGRHHLGGHMYGQALRVAMDSGWAEAHETLQRQKAGLGKRDDFGLASWGPDTPWVRCTRCGKGRHELSRNLAMWIPKCNLTPGCNGTLERESKAS